MPLKSRSLRTTSLKSAAREVEASLREAKSATATFGLLTPKPVPVRNQSWAAARGAQANSAKISGTSMPRAAQPVPNNRFILTLASVFQSLFAKTGITYFAPATPIDAEVEHPYRRILDSQCGYILACAHPL